MLETQRMEPMIRRRKGGDVDHRGEGEDKVEVVESDDVEDENIDWEEEDVRGGVVDEMVYCSVIVGVICLLSILAGEGTS